MTDTPKPGTLIKIDKGIPAPVGGIGPKRKYPFAEMEVGDSFFVPGISSREISNVACHALGKGRYNTQTLVENGVRGARVWRTK
jgi:hypothetical protein